MEEREFVGVLVGLEGGFVHQSANGEVGHYEAVEFLANQVGGLAAQDDFGVLSSASAVSISHRS